MNASSGNPLLASPRQTRMDPKQHTPKKGHVGQAAIIFCQRGSACPGNASAPDYLLLLGVLRPSTVSLKPRYFLLLGQQQQKEEKREAEKCTEKIIA